MYLQRIGFTFHQLSQPVLQGFSRNLTSDTITDKEGSFLSRDKKCPFNGYKKLSLETFQEN